MHLVPAPAVRLMKSRVLSIPGVKQIFVIISLFLSTPYVYESILIRMLWSLSSLYSHYSHTLVTVSLL
jgi:hypothetical protein